MTDTHTSTAVTPASVTSTLEHLLADREHREVHPHLTYLRRKPGRGLVAVYGEPRLPGHLYTLTVDEAALTDHRPAPAGTAAPAWQGEWPGLLEEPSLGMTLQAFPHDRRLPELSAAMTPTASPLREALERAARRVAPGHETWSVAAADAVPVRYKPGDRCVIRYQVRLAPPGATPEDPQGVVVGVIGKVYREVDQALAAAELLERLGGALPGTSPAGTSWSPACLGVVAPLPLVLSEDLGSPADDPPTVPGTTAIRFGRDVPVRPIHAAAEALADLHTSGTTDARTPVRTGGDEAAKAAGRARLLARYLPELAPTTERVAGELCARLAALESDLLWPGHGSYKPSQLLFRDGAVFIVDFDQFCRADPALDVGYFLAYLRPPGLWYHRAGTRRWFEQAAAAFLASYEGALIQRGVDAPVAEQVSQRAHVYEAGLLMKIAARRANRMHSPRPGEVRAVLAEVEDCLARAGG